jgi:thioesterase domain-containing protein
LGRKTRKIKLSGYSVEPYEIENALLRMKGVRDAAVVANGAQNDRHLVAYVAAASDAAVTQAAVRQHIQSTLPAYMVPRHVVIMNAFPLTARGKVDLSALPSPGDANEVSHSYRAPQSEQERVLSSIWQEILQRPRIGLDDNFYELGGTSLQAFLIFARIASALGQDLPPTAMLEAPTIAKQTALLARMRGAGPVEQLVPFRREGTEPPLFIVHGAYADIMFGREIVRDLKSSRPIYGLQPPPLDGRHKLPRTMEAIASGYLAEVRKAQPKGPYFLAGYSFGGMAALEMAQQLTQSGETVAFLGLIDSSLGGRYEIFGEDAASRITRHLRQMGSNSPLAYVSNRVRKTFAYNYTTAARAMRQLPNVLRLITGRPIPYKKRAECYQHIFVSASRSYRAKTYAGTIVILSAQGRSEWHRARWNSIAQGGLTIYEVPANHFDMVWPPHSTMLAQHFDAALASTAG